MSVIKRIMLFFMSMIMIIMLTIMLMMPTLMLQKALKETPKNHVTCCLLLVTRPAGPRGPGQPDSAP